jgi:hypothetical protein
MYWVSSKNDVTWEIVSSTQDRDWNYDRMSINPNITFDVVNNNPDKTWNSRLLSRNPNITLDIILANPEKPWDNYTLCINPNITYEMMLRNDRIFSSGGLFRNVNLTWREILKDERMHDRDVFQDELERWNMSAKIQHVYRRWYRSIHIFTTTSFLHNVCEDLLPIELYAYISSFMM